MKSNRMRLYKPLISVEDRLHTEIRFGVHGPSVNIEEMPAPLPVTKISPDQMIEDILVSTLLRLQKTASPELAAAAARYIALLSEKAL